MTVTRLHHVVFAVQDLEQAARAWVETLGLGRGESLRPPGSNLELAPLPLGDPARDAFCELVAALAPEQRLTPFLEERGEGMLSMSLEVDDLDAAVRDLRAQGVVIDDPEAGLLRGTRVARLSPTATHGVRLQLLARA
jgi:catechol 2,3-dioxygenase-like lactoylglutathione lyase family enzyme